MKKIIAAIAIVLTMGIVSTSAYAYRGGPYGGHHMMGYYGETGWTEKEIKETNEARNKFFKETTEIRKEIAKKNIELEALYLAEEPDVVAFKKIRTELIDLTEEINKKAIETGVDNHMGWGRHMTGRHMTGWNYDGHMMGGGYGRHMYGDTCF